LKIVTRGKGKSAVAAAAYRAGETIKNEYDGIVHDYSRKGGIVHTEILLPGHAPAGYKDRAILWNAVEKAEKSSDAQLARDIDIALPMELTLEQNIALARRYVQDTFVNAGMCADLCIHDKGDGNPHAHIMLTMRPINDDGKWGGKQKKEYILDADSNKIYDLVKRQYKCRSIPSTDWNKRANADIWRKAWEDMTNAELERLGFDCRIDRRTYAEQGIEQVPTVHLGVAAMQMERRGIRTKRGDINRAVAIKNSEIKQLRARINKLDKWLEEEAANLMPPTLSDVISEILSRQGQSSLTRLKNAAEIHNFLHDNQIYDIEDLDKKVRTMKSNIRSIGEEMKKENRRIETLTEHLKHGKNYKEYRKLNAQYEKLYSVYETARKDKGFFAERKAQKALEAANDFYEANRAGITLFKTADKYLRGIMQDRFDPKKLPPISKWEKELAAKEVDKARLYQGYVKLKDETKKVEQIQRSVKEILHTETQERTRQKSRGMEL
jgi:ATP-dependent exoDNAse (exonuclease V) alpha subunit